jgi:hypothetical protein
MKSKLSKHRSEVGDVMAETKYGSRPSWRRYAKRQHRKALRATEQVEIAHQLSDIEVTDEPDESEFWGTETLDEWMARMISYELWDEWEATEGNTWWCLKQSEMALAWHIHEMEAIEEDRYLRNRYPHMYHDTASWDEDASWIEDSEEFFGCEEF